MYNSAWFKAPDQYLDPESRLRRWASECGFLKKKKNIYLLVKHLSVHIWNQLLVASTSCQFKQFWM